MKRITKIIAAVMAVFMLAGCGNNSGVSMDYISISAEEAKEMMNSECIILDVRTDEEFAEGHIENAILIPVTEISERAETELPDKKQLILVYCRSGNRSKTAASQLAELGYDNVYEFGGINDWPYETVK